MNKNYRKVQVFKWVRKEGKSFSDKEKDYIGKFHEWGMDYEEFETGPGNFSVGIIEKENGEIELVFAELIQFLD